MNVSEQQLTGAIFLILGGERESAREKGGGGWVGGGNDGERKEGGKERVAGGVQEYIKNASWVQGKEGESATHTAG